MPLPYRAALFDLDGTLISVGVDRARSAVAAALRARGHAIGDGAYAQAAQRAGGQARSPGGRPSPAR